ncbi:MATE family efflux transporter [Xylanibacter caecicola]|uniref:MATE family efflux transporter n=1 Tax=Xylanibacter caecicola TaxID=2736294 RepID=UPI00259AAA05|nr:MATE family efflux transporter [Xylanibacter caecicola]
MLALPVVLTQLGQIFTQVVDNLMIGHYGGSAPEPLAAVSFGGSVFTILYLASIGVALGMTPLIGELYVQGNRHRSSALLQNGMAFYVLLGVAVSAVQYAFVPVMYRLGQPADVVDMAVPYYNMLVMSVPFVMLFFAFKQFLEGTGNTKVELMVTIAANILNCLLNYVFIFGNLGCTEMGVEGAGLGTLLSRVASAILITGYFIWQKDYRAYLKDFALKHFSLVDVRRLLRMGLPISAQMFLESSAFIGTGIMMGWLSKEAISANQIANTMSTSAFMIVLSIGAATTIRTSHCYGRRDIDELSMAVKASYHLVLAWNTFAAIVFISLCNFIPALFTENTEVIDIASSLFIVMALFQLSDGVQNVSVGVLRGIQDVKIIMPIAFTAYWLLNLPVGYLLAFTLDMGPAGMYVGYIVGLSVAAILMIGRIRRRIRGMRAQAAAR